jgi:alpha-tubulin suppressor-like RCC1 family protein
MLNSQNLIDKICAKISQGGLTDLQTCQTTNSLSLLENTVFSVETNVCLPSASAFIGRPVYVNDENRYYFSNGTSWQTCTSTQAAVAVDELWGWGANTIGQLGNGTAIARSSPTAGASTDLSNWSQVSSGNGHGLAIRSDRTAWAWGQGTCGRLGTGTLATTSSPVSVVGRFTDWCQVSAGSCHSLGVRQDGTAWAWGQGLCGKLGNGTTINRSSPVSVAGGFTDWCQVSAGCCASLGVRQDGTAWAWGAGTCGILGNGTLINRSSPTCVVGGFTDWCQVSIGRCHSLGVRQNGTVWAWGGGTNGRLGNGAAINRSSPVSVVGGFTDWCQVSAGYAHSLGLRTNGTAWAWGINSGGQLGDGTVVSKLSPVSVIGGFTDWCQVSTNVCHNTGIRTNGTVWSWGLGSSGQMGNNSIINRSSPTLEMGAFSTWKSASAGSTHVIGILQVQRGY